MTGIILMVVIIPLAFATECQDYYIYKTQSFVYTTDSNGVEI
jgi:hypothetical protein